VSVRPGQPVGRGPDVIQAGWLSTATSNVGSEIFRGWSPAVLPPLDAGGDTSEADTHRRFLRGCVFGRGCESPRLHRGRPRFDGDTVSQDACRGPSTSTKDGKPSNCGHAARSRSLITCERPPRSACGPGTGCHLSRLAVDGYLERQRRDFSGLVPGGFSVSSRRERHFRGGYAS
jgi:hypothetical protein